MKSTSHLATGLTLLVALGALWSAFGSPAEPAARLADEAGAIRTAASHGGPARRAAPGRASLLLSPFGTVQPPPAESLPADASVRTRDGRYALRWQADELDRLLGGAVAWVDVGCCTDAALDVAQGGVHGLMAAEDLAADAPVFVTGADLHQAARLADRLSAQGLTRVYLVTR
jgi:hypothetical protein